MVPLHWRSVFARIADGPEEYLARLVQYAVKDETHAEYGLPTQDLSLMNSKTVPAVRLDLI